MRNQRLRHRLTTVAVACSLSYAGWSAGALYGSTDPDPLLNELQGISIIADTKARDRLYGATIRLDVGKVSFNDLSTLQIGFGQVQDIFSADEKPLSVTVVVPKTELSFAEQQLKPAVIKLFKQRFGTEKVRVTLRAIDVAQVQAASHAANQELLVAKQQASAQSDTAQEIADVMIEKNKELEQTVVSWRDRFRQEVRSLRSDYDRKTMLMGSAIGLASSVAPVTMWLSTTGLNGLGMAQILVTVLYDQVNTTFAGKLLKFEQEHELPGAEANIPALSKLIRFYNGNTFIKALGVNFAINASTGFSFRLLSWLAMPQSVASPMSIEFLTSLGGMNALSGGFTAGGDVGIRQLRRKGYISGFTETTIASSLNFMAQINNLLLGSGMTEYLPYALAMEWTSKTGFFLAGKILPTKTNRFVMIMPGLDEDNLTQVKKVLDLNEALKKDDLNVDQFRSLTAQIKPSSTWLKKLKGVQANIDAGLTKANALAGQLWGYACGKLEKGVKLIKTIRQNRH